MVNKWSQFIQKIPELHLNNFWPYSTNFVTIKLGISYNHIKIDEVTVNQSFIDIHQEFSEKNLV